MCCFNFGRCGRRCCCCCRCGCGNGNHNNGNNGNGSDFWDPCAGVRRRAYREGFRSGYRQGYREGYQTAAWGSGRDGDESQGCGCSD